MFLPSSVVDLSRPSGTGSAAGHRDHVRRQPGELVLLVHGDEVDLHLDERSHGPHPEHGLVKDRAVIASRLPRELEDA